MDVVFRVDASVQMGTGHLTRCLTLADGLRAKGAEKIYFVCRLLPGNLCQYLESKGHVVYRMPCSPQWLETDAGDTRTLLAGIGGINWLVVDHYALDSRWETQMRPYARKIMVIDDLADRPHDCDLLLDQNLYENMETRYRGLVQEHCRQLLGPKYALLRPEFRDARKNLRNRDGAVHRILVFFGGSDPTNETAKALEAVRMINRPDIYLDVVVGAANPHRNQIKQLCSTLPNTAFFCQVSNIANLMAEADLAIGAGGTATWERCFLGLPSITMIVARNQADTTAAVAAHGAAWNLGWSGGVSPDRLADSVKMALGNPALLRDIGLNAMRIMGNGPFYKSAVVQAILEDDNAVA
ncbi:MAG: UDP-2,4-diacetamido-2,4,6-trideoxy-beta-L-altropyranose hydrolase [Firmicutes bacterium]|nr:UDP-2,4-diacetamido-2,4,6-trideoxy-beta-L-altropyranose hydrolase [Bacillota bacterium]MCL5056541.1 UDP-2,4-diacetamido-2,4,6-trideoxy-beta-L-altropyranose hydrolase [Actinomycetota bacterium]